MCSLRSPAAVSGRTEPVSTVSKKVNLPSVLTCQTGPKEQKSLGEMFSQMASAEFRDLCVGKKSSGSKDKTQK